MPLLHPLCNCAALAFVRDCKYSSVRPYTSIRSCIIRDFMVTWLPESHMVGTQIHPGSVDALSFIQTWYMYCSALRITQTKVVMLSDMVTV